LVKRCSRNETAERKGKRLSVPGRGVQSRSLRDARKLDMFQNLNLSDDARLDTSDDRREVDVLRETAFRLTEKIHQAALADPCRRSLDAVKVANAVISKAVEDEEIYLRTVVGPRVHVASIALAEADRAAKAERGQAILGRLRQGLDSQRAAEKLDRAEARIRADQAAAALSRGPIRAMRELVDTLSLIGG
jgi:hypothetical protein